MGYSKFESRPIASFQYIEGYGIWRVNRSEHSLVETVTVNKQIRAQVPLIVRDKQQLLTTINKQKLIISVCEQTVAADLDLSGTSHVVFTLRTDLS
jgi:hypothetical protein